MDKKCVHYVINDINIDDGVLIKNILTPRVKQKSLNKIHFILRLKKKLNF